MSHLKQNLRGLLCVIPAMILFFASEFCLGNKTVNTEAKTTSIERSGKCSSNPDHTYQVFVPSVNPEIKLLPLVIVIEPYGNGKLGVDAFKIAAQKNNAVVVGSNLIKSNDTIFVKEIDELIAEIKSLYPINDYVFIAAFPGMANMAIDYASDHRTDGIIAFGIPDKSNNVSLLKCKTVFIVSLLDFNYNESAQLLLDPTQLPSNMVIETTKDSYSLMNKNLIHQSMNYLLLSTVPPFNINERKESVKLFCYGQKQRIDSLLQQKDYLQAAVISRNMANIYYYEREVSFLSLNNEIMQNPDYQLQTEKIIKISEIETKVRNDYFNSVVEKDTLWWKQEVDLINTKIKSEDNQYTQMSYQRIKGFLGIVCYYMCNRFATENDAKKLEQVLSVYRIAEPDNVDIKRFSKILEKLKQQS